MSKYSFLEILKKDSVGVVRFCRPEQLNAMNRAFMDEIITAFQEMNQDDDVKVVIVTGSGRAFMAGADIKEYADQTDEAFISFQKRGIQLYREAERSNKPYIAMVNGYALGGGFEIACSCDLIVASESAEFGLPEVHLGLVPGGGGTQRLIQKIGINRIKEILYLGGRFTAEQFKEWGIVNYVTSKDELEEKTFEIASKLARRPSSAIAELKRLAYLSTCPVDLEERMQEEGKAVFKLFKTLEAKTLIDEFKRKNTEKN